MTSSHASFTLNSFDRIGHGHHMTVSKAERETS